MKLAQAVLSVCTAAILLTACKDTVNFKKTKSGVPYKIFSAGNSKDTISVGNIVKYNMIQRVKGNGKIKDSIVTTTYGKLPIFREIVAGTNNYLDPLMDIITRAKKGDSIYITQTLDSFIARQPDIVTQTPFRKGDRLISTIKILDVFKNVDQAQADYQKVMEDYEKVMKKEGAEADKKLDKYIADNHIAAQKTPGGVYIQVLRPGTGPRPDSGQYASVQYKGTHLTGESFDQGVYPLQIGMRGSIPGFEDAVKNMQKGEKIRAFIPSSLGYGAMGKPPAIAPNENLIFEMELIDISNTPPGQQPQLPTQGIDTLRKRK